MWRSRLIWVLAVGAVDVAIQGTITPALPAIQRHFHASPTAVTWLSTGFLLSAVCALPLVGPLGDRYGRRRVLLWSLGLFGAGSLVCALAGSTAMLIAGRIIEGLGIGTATLAFAIANDNLPAEDMPGVIGFLIGAASIGSIGGLLMTGVLVDNASVAAPFWALLAVSAALAIGVWRFVPESPIFSRGRVDWAGAALLTFALTALMLAISEANTWHWTSLRILLLSAAAVAFLVGFGARERSAGAPLVPPALMLRRALWSTNIASIALGFAFIIGLALVPLVAGYPKSTGYGLGLDSTQIALVQVPEAVLTMIAGLVSSRVLRSIGPRNQAIVAMACSVVAYGLLAALPTTVAALTVGLAPLGITLGLGAGALLSCAVAGSRNDEAAVTAGVNTLVRTIGSTIGPQVAIAVVVAAPALASGLPSRSGFTHAFLLGIVASVVAAAAAAFVPTTTQSSFMAAAS